MAIEPPQSGGPVGEPAHAWQGLACWRVLDTQFENGRQFFECWQAWSADTQRPRLLHYVAFTQEPPCAVAFSGVAGIDPALANELADQWFGLLPGFHRFLLDQGQVILTLCVGDTLDLLRQQKFAADTVALHVSESAPVSLWTIKALARCCRRGTHLKAIAPNAAVLAEAGRHLTQCGFEIKPPTSLETSLKTATLEAGFNPRWTIKNTRHNAVEAALPIGSCAVVGAGLAGAGIAAALARRGWQVTVLDQAEAPAAGASGLPVGLVVPHVSADDCALSRLSRSGVRLMLQQARGLLHAGQDWAASGVLERHIDGSPALPPGWCGAGQDWSDLASSTTKDVWHKQAAWLKPGQLVRAWLGQPGVTFMGGAHVARLRSCDGLWELLGTQEQVVCRTERVVLANAGGAAALLAQLQQDEPHRAPDLDRIPAMQGMRGLLSWSNHDDADPASFPPQPVNGSGSMVPNIPVDSGCAWFMGSSYQPDTQPERSDQDNHGGNWQHLQQLLPDLADQLRTKFESGQLKSWKNTRCVTSDRLPAVGPLEDSDTPGLWICAGLGSRGLSFSMLCAELLAARWGAEPWPVEASLAKALNAMRD
ncbi:MAG: hypothetical protein RLZZ371_914 [Pseudomonadota bacterium]